VNWDLIVAIVGAAVTGTWVLSRGLGRIESALARHVGEDDERHKDHDRRIVRIEDWKDKHGRR